MKEFWKKYNKKIIMLSSDLLIVPGILLCRWLSSTMLSTETVCVWLRLGGKCITCGGTHFVNSLCSGDIIGAFGYNPFLLALTIYAVITLVFLNLHFLFDLPFAKKVLRGMYSIPAVVLILWVMMLFLFLRNIPLWIRIIHLVGYLISR